MYAFLSEWQAKIYPEFHAHIHGNDEPKREFPNGFASWSETHHEVVAEITRRMDNRGGSPALNAIFENHGTNGLYALSAKLTDLFEEQNEGETWKARDWRDTLDEFLNQNL